MNKKEKFALPETTEQKITTFEDIIDINKELPQEYKELIAQQEERYRKTWEPSRENYSKHWISLTKPTLSGVERDAQKNDIEWLTTHLKDDVLVDLGCGDRGMQHTAEEFQIATCINVDRYWDVMDPGTPPDPLNPLYQEYNPDKKLQRVDIKADILDFISRLKDGCANFSLNGIDGFIINDRRYHVALAQELIRATKVGGVILGIDSNALRIINSLVEETKIPFKLHELKTFTWGSMVFEKTE